MPAYVINEIVITEPDRFQTYADQVPPILKAYGGEYVVRGGAPERVDGPEPPHRLVVLRFALSGRALYSVVALRIPRNMFTSSCSSRARAYRRRNFCINLLGCLLLKSLLRELVDR